MFKGPEDYSVTNQFINTTDGASQLYTLVRTFGEPPYTGTEPIGYLDQLATFNVYLDGNLKSPSSYSIMSALPVAQKLRFNTIPAAGKDITVEMR